MAADPPAAICWDCGQAPVEREGFVCDECSKRGARIANGSLDAERSDEAPWVADDAYPEDLHDE